MSFVTAPFRSELATALSKYPYAQSIVIHPTDYEEILRLASEHGYLRAPMVGYGFTMAGLHLIVSELVGEGQFTLVSPPYSLHKEGNNTE